MSINSINQTLPNGEGAEPQAAAIRRAGADFEGLLLTRLTAALNVSEDADGSEEEGLFSGSATGLYRQLFSEQIAKVMAESGGVGLADAVLRQFSAAPAAPGAQRAIEAARLVRAEGEPAAFSPGESNPLPVVKSATNEAEPGEVEMQRPLSGRISSPFGLRRDPIHGHQRRHSGVDIAAPRGTEIKAAAPGTVVFAGRRGGYGNLVEIEHADGRRTRYAHAAELLVTAGDQVSDGQPIATVGATGRATGPHLHFEVMENGVKVNPLQALAKDGSLTRR